MARLRPSSIVIAAVAAGLMAGCSETLPLANLPDITKLPSKLLTKEDQEKAMNQMIEKGQTQQMQAVKQIEQAK
jgi:type IV pilus biogenesis protein CpaD/CtpE